MNYVMYYDYDNYYDAYENYPRVPDGSVLKMAQCLVKFNCLEEPQLSFWVDGEKYKRAEAKSICDKSAKILTYIFAVPIFYSNNYFGESEDVLEIVDVVPEELSQKVAFIENSINTLDNKMDCFEKTLRHLSIAYYHLFKKRDEDAFFFFYKIIECISQEHYDLKKDTFDPEHKIDSNLEDINNFLDDYLKRHFKIYLTKNKLYYESKKIRSKILYLFDNDMFWKISYYVNQNKLKAKKQEIQFLVQLRNKIAHGNLVSDEELLKNLWKCEDLAVQMFSQYFFGKRYEELHYESYRSLLGQDPYKEKI